MINYTSRRLLMVLIKIAIMGLVMTGLILINIKYMSNADGSEKEGRRIHHQFTNVSIPD
jgi:hypothetical protein